MIGKVKVIRLCIAILILFISLGCSMNYQPVLVTEKELSEDPRLIEAIIQVESNGNTKAVYPKGARGLMQLMPGTARYLGYHPNEMFNPEKNKEAGTRYFKELKEGICNGNTHCALRAYNCGPGKRNKTVCHRYADKVLKTAKELGYTEK